MMRSLPCLVTCFLAAVSSASASAARPNFVVIMADDMGYGDAGCYGGTSFDTPNIDRLAREGLKFTDFHSSGCVCSPTRAGLLTGRYQQRAGVDGVIYAAFHRNRHHGLQHSELTLAEILREAGYRTAAFGKWHLGYEPKYNPVFQGFDQFAGYVSGNVDFHTHVDGAGVFDWWHQDELNHEQGYTTHLITRHACDFIKAAATADSQPFCLYIAHEAPHDPYQGPNDPPVREVGNPKQSYNHREPKHAKRAYAEMMTEMDRGIGAILKTLQETHADDQTLLMFFSDNGATGPGSCGDLYGMKGTLWEGGHRVPFLARWPGRIPAGSVSSQLASTIDVLPTMLELAHVAPPSDHKIDGQSLVSTLLQADSPGPRSLFWEYGQAACMREGTWKLIIGGGRRLRQKAIQLPQIQWDRPNDGRHELALFDLEKDRGEHRNLATQYPGRVARMRQALEHWQRDVKSEATPQPEKAEQER